jgi:hypothetical protein
MLVFAVTLPLPSFATQCQYQICGGCNYLQCVLTDPDSGTLFNFASTNNPSMCSISGYYRRSTGAYGYGEMDWTFDTNSSASSTFDINFVLDVVNSHSSNLNRIAVIVYDNTHSTVETIATIDGSGGDVCSGSYGYTNLSRTAWVGSNLTLRFYATYWNSDTEFRISSPSFIQRG